MHTRLVLVLLTAIALTELTAFGDVKPFLEPTRRLPVRIAPAPSPIVAIDCKVFIDGRPAKLKDLRPGMEAVFIIENGVVVQIIATTGKNP